MTRLVQIVQRQDDEANPMSDNCSSRERVKPVERQPINPTLKTYGAVDGLFNYFNTNLFDGQLPHCLLTLQRSRKVCGFFDYRRFASRDRSHTPDEVALNPRMWGPPRSDTDNIATLVHEMVHVWQAHFGKPGRGDYHNREFAGKMLEIGLVPSSTGQAGGRPTGRRVSHYVREDGPFHRACRDLLSRGFQIPYDEIQERPEAAILARRARSRAESKTTYTCPNCSPPVHVWGRPRLQIICGVCDSGLVAEESDAETGWFDRSLEG